MSQEFQKQVDYDYKNRLRSMMRKLSWMLLALLVLAGCGEVVTKEEEKPKVQDVEEVVEEDVGPKEQITWDQDGSKMVLIPAGSFRMGDHLDKMKTALPVHRVELDAFYMDVNEVTVGQFREFVNRSGYNYGVNWDTVAKYSPGVGYPMV
ncbi:MAG: SUMF1/EgtB/PvdO family nonheme iron enzyme, partial [Candidatus Poribacteria bacterium]|nr:SUMF1/EgtB/PvdO family nonheme iron enzyme [Candidatus Poribacteria bacterium]